MMVCWEPLSGITNRNATRNNLKNWIMILIYWESNTQVAKLTRNDANREILGYPS
jgi:hypothetical protein